MTQPRMPLQLSPPLAAIFLLSGYGEMAKVEFKRKSIIVSKSQEMVDLTMALFAKFWVNGNQDELLSLLG